MGRRYTGNGSAASGANKTCLNLISASTIRPALYDIVIGCVATPADSSVKWHVQRTTAVGTEGSGFTPVALDPGDPSSLADYAVAHSSEPTYTANAVLLQISMNQRNTFRWVAAPGGELIAPATANNGLGCKTSSVSTGTTAYEVVMFHEE
jgi:hypothetical protein